MQNSGSGRRYARHGLSSSFGGTDVSNRKKLNANENLMKAMSAVEKGKTRLNENFQDAKKLYYSSIVLDKKLKVVKETKKMLDFMIRNAEIRYKNGLSKISAYYKAKAALGSFKNMQLMYENDLRVNRIRLNALIGRDPLAPLEIEPEYNLNDYSLETFGQDLFYQNRSDLRIDRGEINIAKLKQDLEKQNLKRIWRKVRKHVWFWHSPCSFL